MEDQPAISAADAAIMEALENSRFHRKTMAELTREVTCCSNVPAHVEDMKARGLVFFMDPHPDDGTEVIPLHETIVAIGR